MKNQIKELASYIDQAETLNEHISKGKVGWHIHHCFSVINWTGMALMRSKPEDYISTFSFKRALVFGLGMFPRGKIKVPKNTISSREVTLEHIQKEMKTTERILEKIEALPTNSFMKHPIFNELNVKQSKKFLRTHNEHHLKIIRDILR